MQDQKMIETRMAEDIGRREDKSQERFVYKAPEMFVIGPATRLMQGHNTGQTLDGGHALYYHKPPS